MARNYGFKRLLGTEHATWQDIDSNIEVSQIEFDSLNDRADNITSRVSTLENAETTEVPEWALQPNPPDPPTLNELGGLPITGGTLLGDLYSNNPDPDIMAVRNIYAGIIDMEPGITPLDTGVIYLVYE